MGVVAVAEAVVVIIIIIVIIIIQCSTNPFTFCVFWHHNNPQVNYLNIKKTPM